MIRILICALAIFLAAPLQNIFAQAAHSLQLNASGQPPTLLIGATPGGGTYTFPPGGGTILTQQSGSPTVSQAWLHGGNTNSAIAGYGTIGTLDNVAMTFVTNGIGNVRMTLTAAGALNIAVPTTITNTLNSTGASTIGTNANTTNTFGNGGGTTNNSIGTNAASNDFGSRYVAGTTQNVFGQGTGAGTVNNYFGNFSGGVNTTLAGATVAIMGGTTINSATGTNTTIGNTLANSNSTTINAGSAGGSILLSGITNINTTAANTTSIGLAASTTNLNSATIAVANVPTTASIANILTRNGSGNLEVSSASVVTGSGTQNSIPKWNNAGGTTLGNSLLTDNGTTLGYNFFTLTFGQITTLGASFTNTATNGRIVGITNNDISGGGGNSRALDITIPNSPVATGTATGILFNVAGPGAGTSYDMLGSANTWSITNAGSAKFALPASASTTVVTSNAGVLESRSAASLVALSAWTLTGNAGTTAGTNFIGTTDNQPFEIHIFESDAVNKGSRRVWRAEPNATSANIIAGYQANTILAGVTGSTISGGGQVGGVNSISSNLSTIGGGRSNVIGLSSINATIAGGVSNAVTGSAGNGTIGGGLGNVITSGDHTTISGGFNNQIHTNSFGSTVAGGTNNQISSHTSVVSGGNANSIGTSSQFSTISGGDLNVIGNSANNSTIAGGQGLTLNGNRSFGYLANTGANDMTIAATKTAVFGNTDLWLANNDNTAHELRFYEAYNTTGAFPNTANYTAFKAQTQAADVTYTLPVDGGTAGQMLSSSGGATPTLSWTTPASGWSLTGNAATTPGANYVGTSDGQPLHLYSNGGASNSLILNTNGSLQRLGGNARGVNAVDLQISRSAATQIASGDNSTIAGGINNTASGAGAVIGGGGWDGSSTLGNLASGNASVIGGGLNNKATNPWATVGGGQDNQATGAFHATVAGGFNNISSAQASSIGGGGSNAASGFASTISGGQSNKATDDYSTVGGGQNNTAGDNAGTTADKAYATVAGGHNNIASNYRSTIGGGGINTASGYASTVPGGNLNVASGDYSFAAGTTNQATNFAASVTGGWQNQATNTYAHVGGGSFNKALGNWSAIAGGNGLTLNAANTFGYLNTNTAAVDQMIIATAGTATFGNVNLWLANNDGTARELRFYMGQAGTGAFPAAATKYTAFKAQAQAANVTYTLPVDGGTAGQVLSTSGGATPTLSWAAPSSSSSVPFADFYALMPGDNAATIAPGTAVAFPQDGPTSGVITRLNNFQFNLPNIGTYEVFFQVSVTEAGQLMLKINGIELAYSVVGRATGTSQMTGMCMVTTSAPNTVLEVANPSANATALTITPLAGGTQPVSAHLVIKQLQ